MKLEEDLIHKIEALKEGAFALNDALALNPEVSGREFFSCERICKFLEGCGIAVEKGFAGQPTAFLGRVKEDASSPIRIALLAEYDALPEIGHGCGHCASASISALLAAALSQREDIPPCTIHIIGTPDEENYGAKAVMADMGIFDGYSYAAMIHMGSGGMNAVKADLLALAPYLFRFKGRPAHASAYPWRGKNALNGAMLMLHGVDMLRQHVRPTSRIHAVIRQGGEAPNIVPEHAVVDINLRSPDKAYLKELDRLVRDCGEGAARATQTKLEVERYAPAFDNMLHIPEGVALLREIYEEMGLPLAPDSMMQGSDAPAASSDVGNVSFRCPAFQCMVSVSEEEVPMHTREYAKLMTEEATHRAIRQGAEILGRMVARSLCQPQRIGKMRQEFEELVK